MSDIPINTGQLPNNFCPSTLQAMAEGFGAIYSITPSSGGGGITISANKPSSTSDIWFQIDSLGRFQRTFLFGQGAWLSAHPLIPGATVWWFSALPNFTTFDGGDANAPGSQSGPMWQQAKDSNSNLIQAQFVITPGTLPSGAVLAIGNTGGEEKHILTVAEGAQDPNHNHVSGRLVSNSGSSGDDGVFFTETVSNTPSGMGQQINGQGGYNRVDISTLTGDWMRTGIIDPTPASVAGHNCLPPFVTGFLLQRTARLFYAVN